MLLQPGQSQPPCHLSVFLEVTDPRNTTSEWSCFVSHRLSVINQKVEEKSIMKESQNRYSKSAKDWGWREFVTLTSLFDQDAGFLVQDTVVFSAEVLILKETVTMQELSDADSEICSSTSGLQIEALPKRPSFTWKVENFSSFKEIMETRKIFSKFFHAGGCELRIGKINLFILFLIQLYQTHTLCLPRPNLQVYMSHLIRYAYTWRVINHLDMILIRTFGCTIRWL